MKLYAGIDLHSSNNFLGIIDEEGKQLYSRRLKNSLEEVLRELLPYKEFVDSIVIESTYNWYWLVDGLMKDGYKIHLANPSAMVQYSGLKHTDDKSDTFWLAEMNRLGIIPTGYIYPREERSVRDMLRRRFLFVKQRTAHILSLKSMVARETGLMMSADRIQKLGSAEIEYLFSDQYLRTIALNNLTAIDVLGNTASEIEKEVLSHCKLRDEFKHLLTIPGVGKILAMMIMLEVGDIRRFKDAGNYSSYCRCVKSEKISNNKKKGENNRKNGNKYLSWAYMEAANYAIRYCPEAGAFYQRKMAKKNKIVARKALANKLARASYYIMRDGIEFNKDKLFS